MAESEVKTLPRVRKWDFPRPSQDGIIVLPWLERSRGKSDSSQVVDLTFRLGHFLD